MSLGSIFTKSGWDFSGFNWDDYLTDYAFKSIGSPITNLFAYNKDRHDLDKGDGYAINELQRIQEANQAAQQAAAEQQQQFEQSSADKAMAHSSAEAQLNRDWQTNANKLAMEFSANQAELNRQWYDQQRSNAYQTAVADLKAAGLNPILAASNGGAASSSGAIASGVSSAGSTASSFAASGSKADTDVTTYSRLLSTLISGAFDLGSAILGKLPNVAKSQNKIGF